MSETEVNEFEMRLIFLSVPNNIFGFNVPMRDAFRMNMGDRFE